MLKLLWRANQVHYCFVLHLNTENYETNVFIWHVSNFSSETGKALTLLTLCR